MASATEKTPLPPSTDEGSVEPPAEKPTLPGPPPGMRPQDFPDGGRDAWLAVAGAWCCNFASFGWVSSIGVFQTYYSQRQLAGYSASSISWILSAEVFMLQAMAPVFGKVFDSYGARGLLYFGTFMHVFGLMMMSLGKEYYQLFLAQSICSGIGASALFYASSNAATTWFFKKRALAVGIVASGSALGGLLLPIMFSRMIDDGVSFGWTVRTIAFLFLGLLAIACLSCKSRLKHTPKPFVPLEFVKPLADMRFLTLALGSFFFFWGIFLPTNYIILYAEAQGMSDSLANYQLAILNAMSIFGRIFSGWAADKYGRFNVMVLTITLSVVFVLGLWIPAHANASTIAFSAIYGFFSGSFVALLPTLVAQISDLRQIGVRVGTTFFIASFAGLTGNPIGGALLSRDGGGYRWLQVFCGVSMFVAGCFFLTTRLLQSTKAVAKV